MRPAARLVSCLIACVSLAAGASVPAGRAQERVPGAIRVRITLVPIDVVVTDKDDRPVTDLTQADFAILEDGVRQTISHFTFQALTAVAAAGASGEKPLLRRVPTAELSPETRRTFLIVLGRGRLQRPSHGIDGLITFVRQQLLPQDVVAVLAYNRATDFTADHEKVAQVLERFKRYHEGIEAKMALRFSGLAAIYGSKEIPKSLQAEIARIFDAPWAISARQLPPGSPTDATRIDRDSRETTDALQRAAAAEAAGGAANPLDSLQADAMTDLPFDDYVSSNRQTMQDLQNLYTAIEYLRYMEGEKHLLFFTENGLFLPRLENDRSLAAMANDARVTVDTFQTGGVDLPTDMSAANAGFSAASGSGPGRGGLPGGGARGGPAGPARGGGNFSRMFALASLRNIAQMTGGRASIHADIPGALSRLNDVTRAEYLLGYYPKNGDWNGDYRRLVVRVNRPGLKLSYRRGYYARQSLQPFDRKVFMTYSRIAAAGQYEEELKDLGVKARATLVPAQSGGGQEVQVDLQVAPAKVPFVAEAGLHKATLHVTTFFGDARGRFLGDLWQELNLNLREPGWKKVLADGIVFSTRVPYRVPGQTLKVVVYSYDADRIGSATTRLR